MDERSFHPYPILLDREPLLAPFVESTSHVYHIGVAHLLEGLGRQHRAPTRCARYDDARVPLRREFWFGVGRCRIGIPLQHYSWNMTLLPLSEFPDIKHQ